MPIPSAARGEQGSMWHTAPDEAMQLVERWVKLPALRQLVEADGGTWPTGTLAEIVEALVDFSVVWDRRDGDSRLIFKEGNESRTDERAERVYAAARELGLLDSEPPTMSRPDYLLILGGLATGVEPRVRYAAQLVDSGAVTPGAVVALGSFRQVDERERPVAETYAPGAEYEIDLLAAMLNTVFEMDQKWSSTAAGNPATDPARAEQVLHVDGPPQITAYAARSSAPDERPANTADTYDQFAADVQLHSGQSLLIITSTIYRPYQHLDAVRSLGIATGVSIETVGVRSTTGAINHPPRSYLQEIRSTIRSAEYLGRSCH